MIHSASDAATLGRGELVSVGGRVAHSEGRRVYLVDAFGGVWAELELHTAVPVAGSLVVVSGVALDDGESGSTWLRSARVVSESARSEGASSADALRITYQGVGLRLRERARAMVAIRSVFSAWGYVEVETPLLVPSPGLDVHLDAIAAGDAYLSTSPEYQMKRLVAGGVPRCFQLTRCFRRGEVGARHNPEFTMLEWYRAHASYDDVMHETEAVVCAVADVTGPLRVGNRALDLTRPFARITVAEAFARYASITESVMLELADNDEDAFYRLLVDRVEPAIAEALGPVFLSDYPIAQASLARPRPTDARYAERFELYAGGVELCNGFGELTDAVEQRARFDRDRDVRRARGLPVYPIDERFLAALSCGMPSCAGNALGVDRLIALSLGVDAIGDVLAFPAAEL